MNENKKQYDDLMSYTLEKIPNFKALLDDVAENYSEVEAFKFQKGEDIISKTYPQFKTDVLKFAEFFAEQGLNGAHIALAGENSYDWICAYFAAIISGNIIIPLDRKLPVGDLSDILNMGDTDVLILAEAEQKLKAEISKRCPKIQKYFNLNSSLYESLEPRTFEETDPSKCAAIIFTSGTTGMSKGVMLSQSNLIGSAIDTIKTSQGKRCYDRADFEGNPIDRFVMISVLPYNHVFETANIIRNLLTGTTICIVADVHSVGQALLTYKPYYMNVVPAIADFIMASLMRKMAQAGITTEMLMKSPAVQAKLRAGLGGNLYMMGIGGAKPNPKTKGFFRMLGIKLQEGYGMTECSPVICVQPKDGSPDESSGMVLDNMKIKIVEGEIRVKGAGIMLGYYKNEKATAEAFDEEGYLRTGDIGEMIDGKFVKILGRFKNVIVLANGENIYPEEYEMKLSHANRKIREIVVYEKENHIICEILSVDPSDKQAEAEIRSEVEKFNSERPAYMRITEVIFRTKEFIKTTSGKIKRNALLEEQREAVFEQPQTETEKWVCSVFENILQTKNVGRGSNFFSLGGDSLSAVSACNEIDVPVELLYENPTVRAFASVVDEEKNQALSANADPFHINEIIKGAKSEKSENMPKNVLLTGAGGFLGSHIMNELLKKDCNVYCLIRNQEKFKKSVKHYFGELDFSALNLIKGDIEQINLGLSENEYADLTEKIDTVIHVAANVHHAGDYNKMRVTNYTGTKNIVKFALDSNAVLHHTSTSSLCGSGITGETNPDAVFDEFILNIGQAYKNNVYIHSKYIAEEYVIKSRAQGLKANVYRIGNLTWRTTDGKFQINLADNGFLSRMHALCKLHVTTDELEKYLNDFTAVDECAKAYTELVFSAHTGEIYNLYNPNLYKASEILDMAGVEHRHVTRDEFKYMLYDNKNDTDIRTLSFYSLTAEKSAYIKTNNDFTVARLKEQGFQWSKASSKYIRFFLNDMKEELQKGDANLKAFNMLVPTRIVFESGALDSFFKLPMPGRKALLVISNGKSLKSSGYLDKIKNQLSKAEIEFVIFDEVSANPIKETAEKGGEAARKNGCDFIIGFGGGSVIDAAKAIAVSASNEGDLWNFVGGKTGADKPYNNKPLPVVAIPTTSGTGSEVDNWAVITKPETNEKILLGGTDDNFPCLAVIDPQTTVTLPSSFTAYQGFDALFHAIECYIARTHNPMSDMYALTAAKTIAKYLPKAITDGINIKAREKLSFASMLSGVAMTLSACTSEHSIEHAMSAYHSNLPHGAGLIMISKAYHELFASKGACNERYVTLAKALGKADASKAEDFVSALASLEEKCGVSQLKMSDYGIEEAELEAIAENARDAMGKLFFCDPCPISNSECLEILKKSFK